MIITRYGHKHTCTLHVIVFACLNMVFHWGTQHNTTYQNSCQCDSGVDGTRKRQMPNETLIHFVRNKPMFWLWFQWISVWIIIPKITEWKPQPLLMKFWIVSTLIKFVFCIQSTFSCSISNNSTNKQHRNVTLAIGTPSGGNFRTNHSNNIQFKKSRSVF